MSQLILLQWSAIIFPTSPIRLHSIGSKVYYPKPKSCVSVIIKADFWLKRMQASFFFIQMSLPTIHDVYWWTFAAILNSPSSLWQKRLQIPHPPLVYSITIINNDTTAWRSYLNWKWFMIVTLLNIILVYRFPTFQHLTKMSFQCRSTVKLLVITCMQECKSTLHTHYMSKPRKKPVPWVLPSPWLRLDQKLLLRDFGPRPNW